jgi:hypothetical protein
MSAEFVEHAGCDPSPRRIPVVASNTNAIDNRSPATASRLDRLQPVGQELGHGDPTAAHRGAGIGSGRQISHGSLGRLLRLEARPPGPRSTTNDHTFPLRFTEPLAMGTTVEPGCHRL